MNNTAPYPWDLVPPKELNARWSRLTAILKEQFGQDLKLEAILLLIGMREMGYGFREYSKQEKMDLMHVGTCTILAPSGYYEWQHKDDEGWSHWTLSQPLPYLDIFAQAHFLRYHILHYFEQVFDELNP